MKRLLLFTPVPVAKLLFPVTPVVRSLHRASPCLFFLCSMFEGFLFSSFFFGFIRVRSFPFHVWLLQKPPPAPLVGPFVSSPRDLITAVFFLRKVRSTGSRFVGRLEVFSPAVYSFSPHCMPFPKSTVGLSPLPFSFFPPGTKSGSFSFFVRFLPV